jgi:hypothetical protein
MTISTTPNYTLNHSIASSKISPCVNRDNDDNLDSHASIVRFKTDIIRWVRKREKEKIQFNADLTQINRV